MQGELAFKNSFDHIKAPQQVCNTGPCPTKTEHRADSISKNNGNNEYIYDGNRDGSRSKPIQLPRYFQLNEIIYIA